MQQHERELVVGAFLDITLSRWVEWVQHTGDELIPEELHRHVIAIIHGLQGGVNTYQEYLQALCLLSDDGLLHLVRAAGNSPL